MTLQKDKRRSLNGEPSIRIHGLDKKNFVFIVHCHDDEDLGMTTIEIRSKGILSAHELVWVTCSGGVPHLCHFLYVRPSFGDDVIGNVHVED